MVLDATQDVSLPKAGDSSISGQQRLNMDSSAGIVVGHSPQYLKDEGYLCPASATGTNRENDEQFRLNFTEQDMDLLQN